MVMPYVASLCRRPPSHSDAECIVELEPQDLTSSNRVYNPQPDVPHDDKARRPRPSVGATSITSLQIRWPIRDEY